jgi:hypothetical protein
MVWIEIRNIECLIILDEIIRRRSIAEGSPPRLRQNKPKAQLIVSSMSVLIPHSRRRSSPNHSILHITLMTIFIESSHHTHLIFQLGPERKEGIRRFHRTRCRMEFPIRILGGDAERMSEGK